MKTGLSPLYDIEMLIKFCVFLEFCVFLVYKISYPPSSRALVLAAFRPSALACKCILHTKPILKYDYGLDKIKPILSLVSIY